MKTGSTTASRYICFNIQPFHITVMDTPKRLSETKEEHFPFFPIEARHLNLAIWTMLSK